MRTADQASTDMYEKQTLPLPDLAESIEMLQRQRACMREYIVGAAIDDMALVEDAYSRVSTYHPIMVENMDAYYQTIVRPEALELFDEARQLYNNDFQECMEKIYTLSKNGTDAAELYVIMGEYTDATNKIVENFDKCMEMKLELAAGISADSSAVAFQLLIAIIVVLVIALAASLLLAFYISGLISKPLKDMMGYIKQAGETGNLKFRDDEWANCDRLSQGKDEIGQTMNAFTKMMRKFVYYGETVNRVAERDLTVKVDTLGPTDTFGNAIVQMTDNLNNMFTEINTATAQVSSGAGQIADAAQALAQGSTEQAATVQELSATVADIAEKTKSNAGRAAHAAELADSIKLSAEKGNQQMQEMVSAVGEINQAGRDISRVIKVIDDIAFQTNILALNAAVEAARAGQHGRGFAVVAEEVRNLAAKSGEAAKETNDLIANSIEKAELGARIANETAASLSEIVIGIGESSQIAGEIAASSGEQSDGITEINNSIEQVAQVVQQNSATSEESAASAEELSGQSSMLKELIGQFRLRGEHDGQALASHDLTIITNPTKSHINAERSGFAISNSYIGN
jgi:methyl-accepting chemotaxis protein